MADTKTRPIFKEYAALQKEPAKGSLDPNRKPKEADKPGKNDAVAERETLTISQYQDPRDTLDQQRHAQHARARAASGGQPNAPKK